MVCKIFLGPNSLIFRKNWTQKGENGNPKALCYGKRVLKHVFFFLNCFFPTYKNYILHQFCPNHLFWSLFLILIYFTCNLFRWESLTNYFKPTKVTHLKLTFNCKIELCSRKFLNLDNLRKAILKNTSWASVSYMIITSWESNGSKIG